MTLPASWTQVPVVGSFIDLHGNPCRGRITFTSNQVVVIDGKTVVPKVITAVLVAGSLPDDFVLPSTNDADLSPVGWAYQVREHFDGGRSYGISVPYTAVSIDLATVAPIVQPDEQATVLQIQLAGLSTDTGGVITDEDSILSAQGKLQRQILDVVDTARGVVEAANFAALPGTGAAEIIYITLDDNKLYRWDTDAYVEVSESASATTDDVAEGGSNLYFTVARVRSVVLAGLSTATNAVIAATDTVLEAFGKLQAQVTANLGTLTGHTGSTSNPHSVTAAQAGADPAGTAATAVGVHEAAGDPHPQYTSAAEAAAAAPVQSVAGRDGAVTLTSSDVGLGNVDNTSDANKPVSTAAQTALDLKAPIANPTFTGTVAGITKSMVGLGNVDNVSDANKPVSTAAQTALDLKAPLASPTFTGTVAGITKSMVGLGSADNTSDADKPVSSAAQTALNLKADSSALTAHTGNTSNPHGVTAAQVGADPTGTAASAVSAHEADATAVHAASAISNTPSGNIAATDVQAAINELDAEKLGTAGDATNLTNTIAPQTTAATSKATPVDDDAMPLTDSAAANGLKKLTWANIKATLLTWLQGTVFPSPGAIGGTAPAAGAFTTLSATGSMAAGAASEFRAIRRQYEVFGTVGSPAQELGFTYGDITGNTNLAGIWFDNSFADNTASGLSIKASNSAGVVATVGKFSSIGLAVAGALSATGNATLTSPTLAARTLFVPTGGDTYHIGTGFATASDFGIYNITDSRQDFLISGTGAVSMPGGGGLSVTGAVSATGLVSAAAGSGFAAGNYFAYQSGGVSYIGDTVSGETRLYGKDSITGYINNTRVSQQTPSGLAVTGALSATGTLSGGTSGTGYSLSGSAPAGSLTLDASGNLLIGKTSNAVSNQDAVRMTGVGGNASYGANVCIDHGSNGVSGAGFVIFYYNSSNIGSISQSGTTAVAYNTTSDHRLKENVRPADAYRFMDIQFVDFEWSDGRHDCGVIADQLQSIYPDLVMGEKDATEVRTVEITPAIPAVTEQVLVTPAVEAVPEELDEEGNVIQSAVAAVEAVYETVEVTPAIPAVTEEQTFPVYQQVNYMGLIGRMGTRVQQLQRTADAQAALIETMEARLTALEQA